MAKAQTVSTVGCRIADVLYTSVNPAGNGHEYTQAKSYPINYDINNPARANDCDKANPNTWRQTHIPCTVQGIGWSNGEYSFTYIPCTPVNPPVGLPIDDYAWVFVLVVGAIGGIIISRKGVLV